MVAVRDLDLRHLQAMDAVVATGTFGEAAKLLGFTQSAVSQQIAALERAVGGSLFDRPGGPRRPVLTPLGRIVAEHAHDLVQRAGELTEDVRRFSAGLVGRLDIGTFQSVSTAVLPGLLGALRVRFPHVEVRLTEDPEDSVLARGVLDGRLDLTFLDGEPAAPMEGIELFVDPFVVVARPQDVEAGPVPAALLADASLIGQTNSSCERLITGGLRSLGVEPRYVFRTNDNSAVMSMVRAGMGLAVMPRLAVDNEDPRTVVRSVDPPMPSRQIYLVWRSDRTLSPSARHLIELAVSMTAHLRGETSRSVGTVGSPDSIRSATSRPQRGRPAATP